MKNAPRQSMKVAIIGDSAVAVGVCGLLLTAGYEPALVMPVLSPTLTREVNGGRRSARVTRSSWSRDVVCYASLQEGVEALGDADWIFEASWFPLEKKQALFRYIEAVRKPTCVVTTDESVYTTRELTGVFGQRFQNHFAVTHFFVPVERLPLIELVVSQAVSERIRTLLEEVCREDLKRTVLFAPDTAGFIANRIGMYWAAMSATEAIRLGIPVHEADAALREACNVPRNGAFGLIDLIGLEVFGDILRTMGAQLDSADDIHNYQMQSSALFQRMIDAGRLGSATGTGFYDYDEFGKARSSLNLHTDCYEPLPDAVASTQHKVGSRDRIAEFKRTVCLKLDGYVRDFCERSDVDIQAIHTAMRSGYGWKV